MITLSRPLTAAQISVAGRLHQRLAFWPATDSALDDLAERFPAFDLSACLLKTVAVNQLYGTRVLAIPRMAQHVADVMRDPGRENLVEELAILSSRGKERRHLSFASKFAHFFVDKDRYRSMTPTRWKDCAGICPEPACEPANCRDTKTMSRLMQGCAY